MVYFNLYGNLGNLLFQYAAAVSLGQGEAIGVTENPKTLAQLKEYDTFFDGLKTVSRAPEGIRRVDQVRCDPTPFPDPQGGDVLLNGFFQSENYFDKKRVYSLFKPNEASVEDVRAKYGAWLTRTGVTGISVRRGDYLQKAAWHPFVGEQYFRDCLARLPEVRDCIVCSDGLDWCKAFFPKAFPQHNFLFVENESVMNQLIVHTLCANNIVSNSSYSWWGAWLAEQRRRAAGEHGVTLAPSLWLGRTPMKQGATWDDIYFDGMQIVKNRYSFRQWLQAVLKR